MYAVIHTGGKQYRVAKNDVIEVEKLPGEAGEIIDLGEVLMLGDGPDATIGAPLVDGARVSATILEQMRGPKIIVFKKKRRKNYRRKKGHRQDLTVLRITDIVAAEIKPVTAKPKAKPAAKEAKPARAAAPAEPAKTEKPKAKAAAKTSTMAKKSAKTKSAKNAPPAGTDAGAADATTPEETE